jgi:UDP-3-O-[3-hydroxymyristoyl] glucosamine N-acyltransferase
MVSSRSKEAFLMSNLSTTLGRLAELVGGQLQGDSQLVIHGAEVLAEVAAGQITLVDHADRLKLLNATPAAAVVVAEKILSDFIATGNDATRKAAIVVADVHAAFSKIVCYFRPQRTRAAIGVSAKAIVSSSARIGKNVNIHHGATIGDDCQIGDNTTILPGAQILPGCEIGRDVLIGPGVMIYENSIIGDRVIINGGAIIGAYGFGYSQSAGRHVISAQLGYVRIENDVEIGAAATVDRGTYGATTIGEGTKIDNMVQIAHNCRIGKHNLICAQVGIAGSTSTGDYVVIGGQAGLRDHVHIGTGARISAMSGITNNVPDGAAMLGIPAIAERAQKLQFAAMAKLPEMRQEFKALRRTVAELQKAVGIDPPAAGIQPPPSASEAA